jgi:hypothetical protein
MTCAKVCINLEKVARADCTAWEETKIMINKRSLLSGAGGALAGAALTKLIQPFAAYAGDRKAIVNGGHKGSTPSP